jgi:hypothetical protein
VTNLGYSLSAEEFDAPTLVALAECRAERRGAEQCSAAERQPVSAPDAQNREGNLMEPPPGDPRVLGRES